jgi:hypothetical protein
MNGKKFNLQNHQYHRQTIRLMGAMLPSGQETQMALNNFMTPNNKKYSLGMQMVILYLLWNENN